MTSKIKIIDAIGFVLIALGILMTAMLFFAERRPAVEVESTTIQEVPTVVPPPHNPGI
jgi:uncharacterized membrane protein